MDESLLPLIIIGSFLASLVILPFLLYTGMKKIADPVPFRLPAALSFLALLSLGALYAILPPGTSPGLPVAVILYLVLVLFIVLAAMTPYYWFARMTETGRPWIAFSLFAFLGMILFLFTTLGEQRAGGPYSPFFPALPLTGWILDAAVALSGTGTIVYSATYPLYFMLLDAGLYCEIFAIAALYYYVQRDR